MTNKNNYDSMISDLESSLSKYDRSFSGSPEELADIFIDIRKIKFQINAYKKAKAFDEIIEESKKYYELHNYYDNGYEHSFNSESFGEWVEEYIRDFEFEERE